MKTPRPPQHGAAFYLVIVTMAIALATVLTALHTVRGNAQRAADRDGQTLKMARQWVLQHGVQVDLDGALSTRRLGEWQAFSDLPIAPGAGADSTEPNLDGWAESVGCATRDWLPGQALRPVAVSGADARCIGQLPWRTLGLTVPSQRDEGAIPWMVMSPNLALSRASGCWKHYHPASLTAGGASGSCQDGPPYPWIRVVDERGNLLSDRVAIALIAPGPTLPGQTRQANAGPEAYLDRVTILSTCPQPCQPGTYDNADFRHANTQPTTLIKASTDARAAERKGFYASPYEFNDRLVYITIDEWLTVLEARARREVRRALLAFRQSHGYYPFAAALDDLSGTCEPQRRHGRLPINPGSCGMNAALDLPNWLTDSGWHHYFYYAVSSRCVATQPSCAGPGLLVGGQTDVNALLISPGAPIQSAPYAPARGQPQTPLNGLSLSANLADSLDALENTDSVLDVFVPTEKQARPNNDRLEILP